MITTTSVAGSGGWLGCFGGEWIGFGGEFERCLRGGKDTFKGGGAGFLFGVRVGLKAFCFRHEA